MKLTFYVKIRKRKIMKMKKKDFKDGMIIETKTGIYLVSKPFDGSEYDDFLIEKIYDPFTSSHNIRGLIKMESYAKDMLNNQE